MHVERLLEAVQELEEDRVAAAGVGDEAGELPEDRLLLTRGRAQRRRVHLALALGEDAETSLREQLTGVVLNLFAVLRALDEDVGDGEVVVEGQ
jgi:hypothetical protein